MPTVTAVNNWLSSGCALINTRLQAKGFAPPDASVAAHDALRDLNALYAVARAEMARTNTKLGPGERTRGQVFDDLFKKGLAEFMAQDLSRAGLVASAAGYVGGISEAERESVESDTDRTTPRFTRDQWNNS